jgi:hypothetical protein
MDGFAEGSSPDFSIVVESDNSTQNNDVDCASHAICAQPRDSQPDCETGQHLLDDSQRIEIVGIGLSRVQSLCRNPSDGSVKGVNRALVAFTHP